ncbi:hypothetical protein LMH73_009880 [Vibrio splendidus]|nr:hypothetical protein [Vibrio splendidus]MCC4878464.1 hypothetical protein [Vibrio splendidus]
MEKPANAELIASMVSLGDKVQGKGFSSKGKSKEEIKSGLKTFLKKKN